MHSAFKTYAWDLGIFTQALWTTINMGKPFYYTIETAVNPSKNYFGTHFSPILLLIIPFYALYQSPITLLVLQSFIIGLAALPIYWIARDKLNSKLWGLTFAIAFLLHPALHGMNCFDFHTEAFIPLFFSLSFHYFENKEWTKGLIFSILTLSTIEFAPILVLFLGLYFVTKTLFRVKKEKISMKKILPYIIVICIGVFWAFCAFKVMYHINPLKATGLPGNWDNWGINLPEVIINIIRNPIRALKTMVTPLEKVYYVFFIFSPIIFLALLAPLELTMSIPWIIAATLSEYPPYYEPYFQYFGFVAAQIFIASIYGAKKLILFVNNHKNMLMGKKLMMLILILSLLSAVTVSPLGLPALAGRRVEISTHTVLLHRIINLIPANASVATQNDILPHLAQRDYICLLTWPMETEVDFILLDLKSPHVLYGAVPSQPSPIEALCEITKGGKYGVMAYADGILLLKKAYHGTYKIFEPYHERFNYEDLYRLPSTSRTRFDGASESGIIIEHNIDHRTGIIWYGPYAWIYSGNYSVKFRIKTESENINLTLDVTCSEFDLINQSWAIRTVTYRTLNFSDFESLGKWQEFSLNFKIEGLKRIELRGICNSEGMHVALDYIELVQLEP